MSNGRDLNEREVQMAANRFAEELKKYPIEVSIGVGAIIPNINNGCSWQFMTDKNVEFTKHLDAIRKNPNMSVFRIKGGYLLNMNMDYLLSILRKTTSGFLDMGVITSAQEHRQKALNDLQKFLSKGQRSKIGIYNLNDSPRITVNGVSFPAFCVTLPDLLALCVRNGFGIILGGTLRTPNEVSSHILQVIERLEIAPSGNALFIEIGKYSR